ncbi:Putative ribonuclease H protein [Dendrobium catenatum]|uniref:Ribonuclease H protein n=1 Tax=Dendrobium catenatum TaxID=906689 RepID=A0A2I0V7E2_9ASPA|nr:Putative ribonuclease H protein [Dendrobium catenatum]
MDAALIINNVKRKVLQLYTYKVISIKTFSRCTKLALIFGIYMDMNTSNSLDSFVYWIKPKPPYVKLNTDGSVGLLRAGAGGLIRDSLGDIMAAFAAPLQLVDVIMAELNALLMGLQLCLKIGVTFVWIEVDSLFLVQIIKDGVTGNAQYFYLIRKIKSLLNVLNFDISHIFREGNVCANLLANKGSSLVGYEEFDILNLEPSLKGMLLMDKASLPHIRYG